MERLPIFFLGRAGPSKVEQTILSDRSLGFQHAVSILVCWGSSTRSQFSRLQVSASNCALKASGERKRPRAGRPARGAGPCQAAVTVPPGRASCDNSSLLCAHLYASDRGLRPLPERAPASGLRCAATVPSVHCGVHCPRLARRVGGTATGAVGGRTGPRVVV